MTIPNPRRLLGVISALIVWAVWFVVVYALTGVGCREGWNAIALPVGNLLSLLMLLSAVIALTFIGHCARLGYRAWRNDRVAQSADNEAAAQARFLGLMMLLAAVFAAIGTLLGALPIFMLDPCAA